MPASKKAKAAHKKLLAEQEAAQKAHEEQLAAEAAALLRKQRPTLETYNTRITNRYLFQPKKCSEVFQRVKYIDLIVSFISPANENHNFKEIILLSHVCKLFERF